MPSWDFKCPNGHVFELSWDTMAESKLVAPCQKCGQDAQRLIAGTNPIFGLQSGTYKGESHQKEVQAAMKDYATGNSTKKEQ